MKIEIIYESLNEFVDFGLCAKVAYKVLFNIKIRGLLTYINSD